MQTLKVTEQDNKTLLKDGRKTFATVSLNKNPEFNWMLWLKGFALSGFKTKEDAINRANEMNNSWKEQIANLVH